MEKEFGLCAWLSTPTAAQQRLADSAFHIGCHSVGTGVTGSTSDNVREHIYHGIQVLGQTVTALGLALISPLPTVVQQRLGFLCEMSLSITFQNILISKLSQRNEHTISEGKLNILKILYHYNPLVFLKH